MAETHSDPQPLTRIAETDAIRRLLGVVARRDRQPAPSAEPVGVEPRPPEAAFVAETGDESPAILPPPLPEPAVAPAWIPAIAGADAWTAPALPPESDEPPPPVPLPVGALPFGDFLARINWRNRPDSAQGLPLIGVPDPPGHADTVGAVLAAFSWDDE